MAKTSDKLPQLPQTVNELLADRAIRHALYLERYKTQVVNEILEEFNGKLAPELLAQIEENLRRVSRTSKRLQALFKDNGELIRDEYIVMESKLYDQLRDFTKVESAWLIKTLEAAMPISFDFLAPNANMLKGLVTHQPMEGALVKEWFGKLARDTAFAVNREIQMGMVEGQGIEDIVRRIKGTRAAQYSDGILNANRHHLRAVVRTSVSNISHSVRDEVYKANQDVVKGVEIMATLDTRTCFECMNLDGTVYDVDEVRNPPYHHGCRCTTVPVLKSWKELGIEGVEDLDPGTRASMSGQVADTMTYPAWLKKQSADVQNEALGTERGKMFRSGTFKLKEFVDRQNRTLTLKQLEALAG